MSNLGFTVDYVDGAAAKERTIKWAEEPQAGIRGNVQDHRVKHRTLTEAYRFKPAERQGIDDCQTILLGFQYVFSDPMCIALVALGVFVGIIFGSIPGLTATLGVTLFIPFTYTHAAAVQGLVRCRSPSMSAASAAASSPRPSSTSPARRPPSTPASTAIP